MTSGEALAAVCLQAEGLGPTVAGTSRLLDRVASHPEREGLLAVLVEVGARSILEQCDLGPEE